MARYCLISILMLAILCCLLDASISKEICARKIFNLNELNPKFDILPGLILSGSSVSIDENNNIFFLDFKNHRILKFDLKGNFIRQIGRIGQEGNSLFEPIGVFARGDKVYVLDRYGNRMKIFSHEGDLISSFSFAENIRTNSFIIIKDLIIVNELQNKAYNKRRPLSIYANDFKKIAEIGKQIKCTSFAAYRNFNEAYLCSNDNSIYGAFRAYPVLFRNDLPGRDLFFHDLRQLGIEEISAIDKEGKERGVDSPESIKNEHSIKSMVFCSGLGVDENGQIYYALNYDKARRGVVLHLDENGNLLEKIVLKLDGKQIRVEGVYVKNQLRLALGTEAENRSRAEMFLLEF